MTNTLYPILAEGDDAAEAWSLNAPDFPEATSWAPADVDLVEQANDMLDTVIDYRREHGEALPVPDDDLLTEPTRDWPAGSRQHRLFYIAVAQEAPPPEPVRVNISIDRQLLARIDQEAQRRGRTRSGFLSEGAKRLLDTKLSPH